jgi:hypothetical protein
MAGQVATSDAAHAFHTRVGFSGASSLPLGLSLGRLLELAPLTPEQGAMVGAAILNQVSVAGADTLTAEELDPRHIRVFPDGSVSIAGGATPSDERDPRAVLRAAGRSICAALGVSPEPDDEPGFTAAEAVALPLVIHARAMAVGAAGADPVAATHIYLERAGRLGSRERLECSREELAALVSRLLKSAGPVTSRPRTAAAVPVPLAPSRPRFGWRLPAAAGLVGALLVVAVVAVTGAARPEPVTHRAQLAIVSPVTPSLVTVHETPAPAPSAIPLQMPTFAPAAAAPIRSVAASLIGPCTSGATCGLDLTISFQPARSNLRLAWKLEVFDGCTGEIAERPGGSFAAPAGWSRVEVTAKLPVPAMKAPRIIAVTTAPSAAQSAPISVLPAAC